MPGAWMVVAGSFDVLREGREVLSERPGPGLWGDGSAMTVVSEYYALELSIIFRPHGILQQHKALRGYSGASEESTHASLQLTRLSRKGIRQWRTIKRGRRS